MTKTSPLHASGLVVAMAGLLAGGCAVTPVQIASAPPSNYRQIVATSAIAASLQATPASGPLEISGLNKTVLGEPGDWRTCIRIAKAGRQVYYAVFFVGEAIENVRQSVGIDRCEQEQKYMTLPRTSPKPAPEPEQKKQPA